MSKKAINSVYLTEDGHYILVVDDNLYRRFLDYPNPDLMSVKYVFPTDTSGWKLVQPSVPKQSQSLDSLKTMTLEEFVDVAKNLRTLADEAEKRFLHFLYQAENTRSIWETSGLSFLELLDRYSICKPTRYERYKRMFEDFGSNVVDRIGIHGILQAASLKERTMQLDYLNQVQSWQSSNGTTISAQSAAKLAREQRIREQAHRHARSSTRYRGHLELSLENEKLRGENEELRMEIEALRTQVKQMGAAQRTEELGLSVK